MISEEMRYYGSPDSREIVELDEVRSDGIQPISILAIIGQKNNLKKEEKTHDQ